MYSELTKLGVDMRISYKEGIMDGFIIYGKSTYSGGQTLSSWGDHRIFMSLFIASLKMNGSNRIDGYTDVVCSFPDFFEQINHITGEKYGLV
jgi:3-phosphoshikimate 1-carboxyvinyltransferase